MATFEQNLAKIRGQAIYGGEMREAIAEAIEQSDDIIDEKLTEMTALVEQEDVLLSVELIEEDDYLMSLSGAL